MLYMRAHYFSHLKALMLLSSTSYTHPNSGALNQTDPNIWPQFHGKVRISFPTFCSTFHRQVRHCPRSFYPLSFDNAALHQHDWPLFWAWAGLSTLSLGIGPICKAKRPSRVCTFSVFFLHPREPAGLQTDCQGCSCSATEPGSNVHPTETYNLQVWMKLTETITGLGQLERDILRIGRLSLSLSLSFFKTCFGLL